MWMARLKTLKLMQQKSCPRFQVLNWITRQKRLAKLLVFTTLNKFVQTSLAPAMERGLYWTQNCMGIATSNALILTRLREIRMPQVSVYAHT